LTTRYLKARFSFVADDQTEMPSFPFQEIISETLHAVGALFFLVCAIDLIGGEQKQKQQKHTEQSTQTEPVLPVLPGGWSACLWEQRQARLVAAEITRLATLYESIERARQTQILQPNLVYKDARPAYRRQFSQIDDAEECRLSPRSPPVEPLQDTTTPTIIPLFNVGNRAQIGASGPNTL